MLCAIALFCLAPASHAQSSDTGFDPSWYDPEQPYVKIAVVEDGVYRIQGSDLRNAGVPTTTIRLETLQLFENGQEVPIWIPGDASGTLLPGHEIFFVGRRNTGEDETWAYQNDPSLQSSAYYSLYSDTTYYWLTWGRTEQGLRYEEHESTGDSASPVTTARRVVHLEEDLLYHHGEPDDAGNPLYTRHEGYYWTSLRRPDAGAISKQFAVPVPQVVATEDTLFLRAFFKPQSAAPRRITLEVEVNANGTSGFTQFDEASWAGYEAEVLEARIPQVQLPDSEEMRLRVTVHNENDAGTVIALLDWIEVSYVRRLDATDGTLHFRATDVQQTSYEITGVQTTPTFIFAPWDGRVFTGDPDAGIFTFSDDPSPGTEYWLAGRETALSPVAIRLDTPSNLAATTNAADYIIITPSLLLPSAEALASYHRSTKALDVDVVDLEDVFDQFDYGRPTPIALRRFVHRLTEWERAPRFLMLWGDAEYPNRQNPRQPWEVPSYGNGTSDSWFAMQTNGPLDWSESIAIGRVPVHTNEQGDLFLSKLRDYEHAPRAAWQKQALFMAGGVSASEQALLRSHVDRWMTTATEPPTGADAVLMAKTTDTPLDNSFQDSLRQVLQAGVGWLTYFGHSAAHTWELIADPPSEFNNAGRLPIALSLGCRTGAFAGDRFVQGVPSLGEELLLASPHGAIAHWGASELGSVQPSATLSGHIHQLVFTDTLRVLGLALQEAKRRYAAEYTSPGAVKQLLQYGLLGDPALQVNLPTAPDFHLTQEAVTVTPITPTPADSQLVVAVDLRNFGLVPADSVDLTVTHVAPDGSTTEYRQRLAPFPLTRHVTFAVRLTDEDVGSNRLVVAVDPENAFSEEQEHNNQIEKEQLVFANDVAIVAPLPYGVVGDVRPELRVSFTTTNASAATVLYQLDTTPSFDSPDRLDAAVQGTTLSATWTPPQSLEEGRTYYWRARIDDASQTANWKQGIFTVQPLDSAQWLQQGLLFEHVEDEEQVRFDGESWQFEQYAVEVSASSERGGGVYKGQFVVNGEQLQRLTLGYGVLIIDGVTGTVDGHGFYPTYDMPDNFERSLNTNPEKALAGLDSILQVASPGDYIFVRTRNLANNSGPEIPEGVKELFRNVGSTAIDTLTYTHLWILFARKGFPDQTREWVVAPGGTNEILRDTTLYFNRPEGSIVSPLIGPAAQWKSLSSTATLPNATSAIYVDVLNASGDSVLVSDVPASSTESLTTLDPEEHPYIRLRARFVDTLQQATPQLESWKVAFDPVPDVALDPSALALTADTLAEAAPLDLSVTVVNLSDSQTRSLLLRYVVTDASNREHEVAIDTVHVLSAGAAQTSTVSIDTDGLAGSNRLRVHVEQPSLAESNVFNNLLVREFFVQADRDAPSLQVTIDGESFPHDPDPVRDLQDPDIPIVPARPVIEIVFADENPFKLLADTSLAAIMLDEQRIPFSDSDVHFEPAGEERNEARIVYTPDFTGEDAVHTLTVHAYDASGNEAENSPYQVHFRVQSTFEVESLYPYPNPMGSFTQFAFLLKGASSSVVEDFRIRIYTLTGRPVQEFDLVENPSLLEGGQLRVGWNKLFWDGRDADGDLLAPGVYLYKVFLKADGEEIRVNNDAGIEKLVILR